MHTIWSKAAQAHSCGCRACAYATSAITRRPTLGRRGATAATAPGRRKVTAADVFTACYTAIMATAAVFDASRKDKRREDLDRRIDDAKAKLSRVLEESTARDMVRFEEQVAESARFAGEPTEGAAHTLSALCVHREGILELQARAPKRQLFVDWLHRQYRLDRETANGVRLSFGRIKTGIMLEENSFDAQREPTSDRQLARTKAMVNSLVDELLLEAYREDDIRQPGILDSSLRALDSAWGYMKILRNEGYPAYHGADAEPVDRKASRRKLNEANDRVLAAWTPECKRHPVAKICYNLLVSRAPPSIHNYNALILGFLGKGEVGLSKTVVASFLDKSQFRPTQQTLVCLLHHYRLTNDILGFYGMIQRIIAKDPRGMRIRQKTVEDVTSSRELQHWASRPEVTLSGDYFSERARLDSDVFEAMIKGLLHFDQVQHAAQVFLTTLRGQVDVTIDTLVRLISRCVGDLNHLASRIVLTGLLENLGDSTAFILSGSCSNDAVEAISRLVDLCFYQRCTGWQRSLRPGMGDGAADSRLSTLSTALFIRNVQSHLNRVGRICRKVESLLHLSARPLADRVAIAVDVLARIEQHSAEEDKTRRAFRDMSLLCKLEDRYRDLERQARSLENTVLWLLSKKIPLAYQEPLGSGHGVVDSRALSHLERSSRSNLRIKARMALFWSYRLENESKSLLTQWLPTEEVQALTLMHASVERIPMSELVDACSRYLPPLGRRQDRALSRGRTVMVAEEETKTGFALGVSAAS